MFNGRYKLHPVTAVINVVKALKDLLIPVVIIIVANGFNLNFNYRSENFFSEMVPLIILFLVVIWTMVNGLIKWRTFTYWFEACELRVEYGLFIRKKRYIPFDRIQSLNYKEGIFHRIFGLVQVQVETAGSKNGKPEAELTAVTRLAADEIEIQMKRAKKRDSSMVGKTEVPQEVASFIVHKMYLKELLLLATTSSGVGVVLAGIFAAVSQFSQFIPFDLIYFEMSTLLKYSVIIVSFLIALTLFIAWLISVALTLLNYYDFTVMEQNDQLIITRGLLEKKRVTIPLHRVQAIKIVENPFRQMLGVASVVVESAGGSFSGEKDKRIVLFPLISKKLLLKALSELFPQIDFNSKPDVVPPKRAQPFFYRLDFLWLIPLIAAGMYFFYPYGYLSLVLIIPLFLLGRWQFKTAGYLLDDRQIMIVSRSISRVTFFAEKGRIQIVQSSQSYFQRRQQIGTLRIVVMSGMKGASATVRHIEQHEVETILKWYER